MGYHLYLVIVEILIIIVKSSNQVGCSLRIHLESGLITKEPLEGWDYVIILLLKGLILNEFTFQ